MLFSKIFNSSTVNRIKNINLPECRNCKHFIAKKFDSQDSNYKIEVGKVRIDLGLNDIEMSPKIGLFSITKVLELVL